MTVSVTNSRVQYATNGTTGPWTVPFYFLADEHLAVYYAADGVETLLELSTDYGVTGAGDESGGTVTTATAYASGGTITIIRDVPATQETDYVETDSFPAESHEAALDKLTMLVQQQKEALTRAIVVPVSEDAPDPIPPIDTRADMLFAFGALGQPTVYDPADLGNIVASRSDVIISVADYGATGDGLTNDTTAIDNASAAAIAAGKPLVFPPGDYLYSGTVYTVDTQSRVQCGAYSGSVTEVALAQNNTLNVVFSTPDTTPQSTDDSRQGIAVTAEARGSQHGVCFRGTLQNYSDDGNGNCAFYAKASSDAGAQWSAAHHGETRHDGGTTSCFNAEAASYSTNGSFYGIIVLNSTNGAETTHPLTGAAKATHPSATAIYITGTTGTHARGGWVSGLKFKDQSMRDGGVCLDVQATAAIDAVLKTSASVACATADILLQGDSTYGVLLNGTYGSAAMRVADDQYIGLRSNNAIKMRYDTAQSEFEIVSSGTERFAVNMGASPFVSLNDVQVVGERNTGWTAMTGSGDESTAYAVGSVTLAQLAGRVKALQDALTTHGLIGA